MSITIPTGAPDAAADFGPDGAAMPTGDSRGKTVIHNTVVAKIAGLAVREVRGVHALGGGAARALGAIREAISAVDHSQGITLEVSENQVAVDVSLVAAYPMPLRQVAEDTRAAVITALETLVGLQVTEVNVTINDVHLPADDADGAGEARDQ